MSTPFDPVLTVLYSMQLVVYSDISALTLYIWDYFITFDMEVDLVWKSDLTFMKCLFLVQRYLPFIDTVTLFSYQNLAQDLPLNQCRQIYQALGWIMLSGTFLSELLLALRVWAVWDRAKWPTVILCLSFVVLWSPSFYCMQRFLTSVQFASLPTTFVGCFFVDGSNVLLLCFVGIMMLDLVTLVLISIPGLKAYKAGGNSALFYVVYRDGATYYFYLVVLSCLNVVAIKTFPLGMQYMFLSTQRCLHTILASRVLLHIRHQGKIEEAETLVFETGHGLEFNVTNQTQCTTSSV